MEMFGVRPIRGRPGLYLDGHPATVGCFQRQIDLVSSAFLADVIHRHPGHEDFEFGANLGDHERVEDRAHEVSASKHRSDVDAHERPDIGWVDEVTFRGPGESPESIA